MKNKPIVIKIGGSTLNYSDTTTKDLATLQKRGLNLVVVHGGAKEVNKWSSKLNISPKFINGLRVTDIETLKVVTAVLCGLVNKEIVSEIQKFGGNAVGLSGVDGCFIKARNVTPELGYTGEKLTVDTRLVNILLDNNYIPVISPVTFNINNAEKDSILLNVNGDTIAAELALALEAEKLIFLTDVSGLLDNDNCLIEHIKARDAKKLIDSQTITGGMSVKIRSCIEAVAKVSLTRIIDGRIEHALIKEINGERAGTTIVS